MTDKQECATETKKNPRTLPEMLADVAKTQLDNYFGEGEPLGFWIRWAWAIAASITLLAFQTAYSGVDPVFHLIHGDAALATRALIFVIVVSPIIVAIAVAKSFVGGRPLRFFLSGFLLYGFLLTFLNLD